VNNKATISTTTIKDKGSINKAAISTKTMHKSILKDQVRFTKAASSSTRTLKDRVIFHKEAIKTTTIKDKGASTKPPSALRQFVKAHERTR
jgi:hypothetical protein